MLAPARDSAAGGTKEEGVAGVAQAQEAAAACADERAASNNACKHNNLTSRSRSNGTAGGTTGEIALGGATAPAQGSPGAGPTTSPSPPDSTSSDILIGTAFQDEASAAGSVCSVSQSIWSAVGGVKMCAPARDSAAGGTNMVRGELAAGKAPVEGADVNNVDTVVSGGDVVVAATSGAVASPVDNVNNNTGARVDGSLMWE